MSKIIIIDPGHGGFDPGAVYENRKEKDDNLRLALAVGQELQNCRISDHLHTHRRSLRFTLRQSADRKLCGWGSVFILPS